MQPLPVSPPQKTSPADLPPDQAVPLLIAACQRAGASQCRSLQFCNSSIGELSTSSFPSSLCCLSGEILTPVKMIADCGFYGEAEAACDAWDRPPRERVCVKERERQAAAEEDEARMLQSAPLRPHSHEVRLITGLLTVRALKPPPRSSPHRVSRLPARLRSPAEAPPGIFRITRQKHPCSVLKIPGEDGPVVSAS